MQPAIIIDIDGTLADCEHRRHHVEKTPKDWDAFYADMHKDAPKTMVGRVCELLCGPRSPSPRPSLIFVTGREETHRDKTHRWLVGNFPEWATGRLVLMRKKDDRRPDTEVKREIYEEKIKPLYRVDLVLDDRASVVKMWRDLGLECWQVAPGDF